jgi:hypothetical protein
MKKQRVWFLKPEGESTVWGMKTGDAMVVADNENVKIEEKGYFCESEGKSGHKIVWNDVGGNRMGLALMNEDLRNHKEDVDEEQREWGVEVR